MVNRAHFPVVYSQSMPSQRSANSSDSNENDSGAGHGIEENKKEIVDWKYSHPKHLSGHLGHGAGMSGGDVIDQDGLDEDFSGTEEEEEDEDDHRF